MAEICKRRMKNKLAGSEDKIRIDMLEIDEVNRRYKQHLRDQGYAVK